MILPRSHLYVTSRGKNGNGRKKGSRCLNSFVCGVADSSAVGIFMDWEIESFASAVRYVTRLLCGLLGSPEDGRKRLRSLVYFFWCCRFCVAWKKQNGKRNVSVWILFVWWLLRRQKKNFMGNFNAFFGVRSRSNFFFINFLLILILAPWLWLCETRVRRTLWNWSV